MSKKILPLVTRLQKMCASTTAICGKTLITHNNDIHAALRSLVVMGAVKTEGLHPDMVSDDVYALAQIRATLEHLEAMTEADRKSRDIPNSLIKDLRKQLAGKSSISADMLALGAYNRNCLWRSLHPRKAKRMDALQPKRNIHFSNVPPLPRLKLYAGDWTGQDILKSWKGFQSRGGPYTSRDSLRPSNGEVRIDVMALRDKAGILPPTSEQIAAYKYLKENEAVVTDAILSAIFKLYHKIRKNYVLDKKDSQDNSPRHLTIIKKKAELRKLIGLGIIHVLDTTKAGYAYIGFECGCSWNDEHGLGIMTHKRRILDVGQADTSFDNWIIKKDGGEMIRVNQSSDKGPGIDTP